MTQPQEDSLEPLESEEIDLESSPASFEIVTYPADFTLEGLVAKYRKDQLEIPGFQREFVWKIEQASRLIESFLLGLPVPAIFLYTDPDDNKQLVIDGQQRLMSVVYFFGGTFAENYPTRRKLFRLTGLNEGSPYANKTYQDLKDTDEPAYNKLNDAVLRAFVIKQLNPNDSTSVYHVFERLNTGGTQLVGQEIRNCVYHGSFNNLLNELNSNTQWREIYGKKEPDNRMRDVELILRFFALYEWGDQYQKTMKDFLSRFMRAHRNPTPEQIAEYKALFENTVRSILSELGPRPFHLKRGMNPAVFDSAFTAFAAHLGLIPADIKERFARLKTDETYLAKASYRTTERDSVTDRLVAANQILFG